MASRPAEVRSPYGAGLWAWAVFLVLASCYLLTYRGAFHIVDEVSMFAVAENLARTGQIHTDQIAWTQWVNSPGEVLGHFGRGGHVYSKKGGAPSFLAVPLVWAALHIPVVGKVQAAFLLNVLVTAATGALVVQYAARLGYGRRVASACGLLFGVGTIAWPYARQFFGEPLSALGLLWAAYALYEVTRGRPSWGWFLGAGLGLALAVATATINALMVPLFAAYAWAAGTGRTPGQRARGVVLLLAGVAAGFAWVALYNVWRFGHPLESGYHFGSGEGFTGNVLQGMYGLLLSPYRGFFWYTPLAWLSVWAFPRLWRGHQTEAALWGGLFAVHVGAFGAWWMWWGGFAWGPRFLVPLAPFVAVALAPLLARWRDLRPAARAALAGALVLSVAVQMLACAANFVQGEILLRSIYPTDWADPLRYGPPALFQPLHSPILLQVQALAEGRWDVVWAAGGVDGLALAGVGMPALCALALWGLLWRGRKVRVEHLLLGSGLVLLGAGVLLVRAYRDPIYGVPGEGYVAILEELARQEGPGDALVTVAPYHYHVPMNRYRGRMSILGLAEESAPLRPETSRLLGTYAGMHERVWLVTAGLPPAAPTNGVERWLSRHAFLARQGWYGDFRLLLYLTPEVGEEWQSLSGGAAFQGGLLLVGGRWNQHCAGGGLCLETRWKAVSPLGEDLVLFVQLLDAEGRLVAGLDGPPGGGYAPTTQWVPGEVQRDRRALLLPPEPVPEVYRLGVGWYVPGTGERVPLADGSGDWLEVARVCFPTPCP